LTRKQTLTAFGLALTKEAITTYPSRSMGVIASSAGTPTPISVFFFDFLTMQMFQHLCKVPHVQQLAASRAADEMIGFAPGLPALWLSFVH
jgi:hypothetical protein